VYPTPLPSPTSFRGARAREDPVLVRAHVQDVPPCGEDVPRPVPVVRIEVEDCHAVETFEEVGGRDRHVVEVAETAAIVGPGVVPRRTHEGERRSPRFRARDRGRDRASRRQLRVRVCVRMNGSVRVQVSLTEVLHEVRVGLCVHGFDLRARGGLGHRPIPEAQTLELPQDRFDPLRCLHVARQVHMARAVRGVDKRGGVNHRFR